MVAYFYRRERGFFRPEYRMLSPGGLPLLGVGLPAGYSIRRQEGLSRRLYRKGIRRALAEEGVSVPSPLTPVDPLPLCRAKGGELALALLAGLEIRQRRVALRGEKAGPEVWAVAEVLCPRVGALFLEFDRGEEALARHLRARYGVVSLPLGLGRSPQLGVEFSPCSPGGFPALRLWGEPDLLGLTLRPEEPLPPGIPALPLLELLWETGRVRPEKLRVLSERDGEL